MGGRIIRVGVRRFFFIIDSNPLRLSQSIVPESQQPGFELFAWEIVFLFFYPEYGLNKG